VKVEIRPAQEVLPPVQVAQVVSSEELFVPSQVAEVVPPPSPKDKAAQRVAELKANAEAIRAEVSELKKVRTKLNEDIKEKEARICAFEFACDEIRDMFGF
jgi:septal ring factor EnvC (AmiA/AmiB activator)